MKLAHLFLFSMALMAFVDSINCFEAAEAETANEAVSEDRSIFVDAATRTEAVSEDRSFMVDAFKNMGRIRGQDEDWRGR